jgi:CubicO group peptidase (beta-lactamase class C family)
MVEGVELMNEAFAAMREQVQTTMERLGIPGVAYGISLAGNVLVDGLGVTNINHPLAVDSETLFQIGSITKTVTGTAAMRLVAQGRLDLDAPVCRYLPELRLRDMHTTAQVTMRHLLTHTTGFVGDFFLDTGWGDDALARYVRHMADLEQVAPLGSVWSYCNSGFGLAAYVIEAITGQTVEQAITDLVLTPFGMDRAFFFPWEVMTMRFAVGHRSTPDGAQVLRPWPIPRASSAVGAIAANVTQLLRYGERHLNPDPTLAAMQIAQVQAGNAADYMGITWMLRDIGGVRLVQHGGATNGQMAQLTLIPERQFAIALLTNSDHGGILNLELVRWALDAFLDVKAAKPGFHATNANALNAYTGTYRAALTHLVVSVKDEYLWVQAIPQGGFPDRSSPPAPTPPPVRIAFTDVDRVLVLDAPYQDQRAEFVRDAAGQIEWLRFGSRIHKRVAT